MMTAPIHKVSVIMPAYNRADYIGESIESVQKQTYPHWELIIVDDGSDDDTESMVRSVKDARIQYYRQEHAGMAKALSTGMAKADGDFIAFIDSDDLWAAGKLEKQINAMQEYPEAGFCMAGGYNFRKPGEALSYFYPQTDGLRYGDLFISFFNSEIAVTTPTFFFRKSCLQRTEEFEDLNLSHIYLMVNLSMHFKGIILYEPLFFRRLHDNNDSTLNDAERHQDGIRLIKYFKTYLPRQVFADSMFRSHMHFGEKSLKNYKQLRALSHFLKAWRYRPLSVIPSKKIAKSLLHFS